MATVLFFICLLLTVGNIIFMAQKKYKNTDRYLWTMLILIPIVILGYWIKSTTHSSEAAYIAFCIIYIDSTFLPVLLLFSMLNSMGKSVNPWLKLSVYAVTALHLFSIWISKDTKMYYNDIIINETNLGSSTKTIAGPLKITHYIFLVAILVALIAVLITGFVKKGNSSRKNLIAYSSIAIVAIVIYTVETIIDVDFTVLPGLYTIGSFMITINYEHIQSHDIFNIIGEHQSKTGIRAYCAFDMKRCLLTYNPQFEAIVPEVSQVIKDEKIPGSLEDLYYYMNHAMDVFDEKGSYLEKIVIKEKTFQILASKFSVVSNNKQNGYLIELTDITEDQKKLEIIEKYNERLSEEVSSKTEHIRDIQNSVVLGLANMVENRDDNTGGHVKRTSEIIKFLVDEIIRQKTYPIDTQTAKDIVRAAPMHDLGKISIDSDILCKPARLTDEEFAIMKTHAPKSGEIVKIILEGVEEQHFVDISYRLARHHHERWDGKGYPDGLMGESIPVEARIMAVADVYDALVSKRCYKEAMSFETAFKIMNECMGSQFDPAMRPVFVACRKKLEAYYSEE